MNKLGKSTTDTFAERKKWFDDEKKWTHDQLAELKKWVEGEMKKLKKSGAEVGDLRD
jgi:hypothetical protein